MNPDEPRYVGVDLAWGERARTGGAVLDVDAPLVVANETGRRPCAARVGDLFGRSPAGAYPANRGNPAFRLRPRARLAERFGRDLDPAVGSAGAA